MCVCTYIRARCAPSGDVDWHKVFRGAEIKGTKGRKEKENRPASRNYSPRYHSLRTPARSRTKKIRKTRTETKKKCKAACWTRGSWVLGPRSWIPGPGSSLSSAACSRRGRHLSAPCALSCCPHCRRGGRMRYLRREGVRLPRI